jgi:hypothetical protein
MSNTTNLQTDFELAEYVQEIFHEVNSLVFADEDGATKEDKFTEYIMEILADAGETEGIRLCHYEKENRWENIQFKINGYAIEEGFETLDIFITSYKDTNEIYRLAKSDFDKLIKWPTDFLNAIFKGYEDEIEPSTEAYGLATLVKSNRNSFVRVNIFVLSNGNIPHDPPKNFKLKGFDDLIFNFHIWDVERLHRLSQSKNNREPIEIDFEKMMDVSIPCLAVPIRNNIYECYLAIVPGSVLATLYHNFGTRLLESNVRAFLQQTGQVNKGIRDTIIGKEPYMFLPYNNGLATTAQEVKTKMLENGQLTITGVKDFQIVNGGQTTASLFHTQAKYKADLSEIYVQMKLTVIKDEDKKNEAVPNISKFANSQNKVSDLDLTSNNPFLQRIESLSLTTYAIDPQDRNKQTLWFFERVKGQYKEALNKEPTKSKKEAFKIKYPRHQIILKSEMAKYMNTWKQLPFQVAKGAQKNYNSYLKDIEKEFPKKNPGRVYWQDVVANAILFQTTDTLFGRKNQDPVGDTNVKAQTVAYTLSYLHHITNGKLNLGKIWENQFVEEGLRSELKKGLYFIYTFFNSLGVALVSETAKSEKTWLLLKEKTTHPFDFAIIQKYLITDEEYKARYQNTDDETTEVQKYNDLQKIVSLGYRFWDGLNLYLTNSDLLSKNQENHVARIRQKLKSNGEFTIPEITKGLEVLEILKNAEIDFEKIVVLSKAEEVELADPAFIYNKLKLLDTETWSKILDLGEQTETLNFSEISAIKTVIQKLKRHETIDLKRMQLVEQSILKLKKYGIKI